MDINRLTTALGLKPSVTTLKTIVYSTATGVPLATVIVRETADGQVTIDANIETVQELVKSLAHLDEFETRQDGFRHLDDCLIDPDVARNHLDRQREGVYRAPEGFGEPWIAASRYGTTGHSTRDEARKAYAEALYRVSVMDSCRG